MSLHAVTKYSQEVPTNRYENPTQTIIQNYINMCVWTNLDTSTTFAKLHINKEFKMV